MEIDQPPARESGSRTSSRWRTSSAREQQLQRHRARHVRLSRRRTLLKSCFSKVKTSRERSVEARTDADRGSDVMSASSPKNSPALNHMSRGATAGRQVRISLHSRAGSFRPCLRVGSCPCRLRTFVLGGVYDGMVLADNFGRAAADKVHGAADVTFLDDQRRPWIGVRLELQLQRCKRRIRSTAPAN
eukprot:SAG22_NODE_656_length_8099_cov_2.665500_2_plen_188_part_00